MAWFSDTQRHGGAPVVVERPQGLYPQVPGSAALSGSVIGPTNPVDLNVDPYF